MIFESVPMSERLIWFPHYFIMLEGVVKVKISRLNLIGPFDDSRYQLVPMGKHCENKLGTGYDQPGFSSFIERQNILG